MTLLFKLTMPLQSPLRICMIVSLCMICAPVFAKEPETLKEVMQIMGEKYNEVAEGILEQDYKKLIAAADVIAHHPEPALSQRLKMIAKLGTNFTAFKAWDDKVHLAAVALGKAAEEKNEDAILEYNAKMLKGCTSCHSEFRADLKSNRD